MKVRFILLSTSATGSWAFCTSNSPRIQQQQCHPPTYLQDSPEETEWTSDFDDFIPGSNSDNDDDTNSDSTPAIASIFKKRGTRDWSGIQSRQFSLGEDLVLADFVGKMGFDEVTDWEYYYQNEEDPNERKVVQPNPFDESKPKRTRKSSGSVVSGLKFGGVGNRVSIL